MLGMAERRDFLFESGAFASENEMLGCENAIDRNTDFVIDGGLLRGQIKLRNRFVHCCRRRIHAHRNTLMTRV
jgi:hypothetical protein